jgi:hypothetical protein
MMSDSDRRVRDEGRAGRGPLARPARPRRAESRAPPLPPRARSVIGRGLRRAAAAPGPRARRGCRQPRRWAAPVPKPTLWPGQGRARAAGPVALPELARGGGARKRDSDEVKAGQGAGGRGRTAEAELCDGFPSAVARPASARCKGRPEKAASVQGWQVTAGAQRRPE